MTHIVVTGATGFLGRHFAKAALADGMTVTALTRRPDSDLTSAGAQVTPCGLEDWEHAPEASAAEAVVHFAAATSGTREGMLNVARSGVRAAVALCHRQHIPRLVHISSLSVYGPKPARNARDPAADLDEHAEFRGAYAHSKVEAERTLHAAIARGETEDLAVDIVRPGLVFGWEMTSPLGGTAVELPMGVTLGLGRKSAGVPVVHIDDVSDGLLGVVTQPPEHGVRVLDLLSSRPISKGEFVESYERLTGRGRRPLWVPRQVAVNGAAAAQLALRMLGRPREVRYAVSRLWDFDPTPLPWEEFWRDGAAHPRKSVDTSLSLALSVGKVRPPQASVRQTANRMLRIGETDEVASAVPPLVLVGAGRVVQDLHVPALDGLGARVAGIVDPDVRALEELAPVLHPEHDAPSLSDLDEEATRGATAVISTPGFTHADLAVEAMQRGMDVLLEKPAATSKGDLERVRATAQEYGAMVTVIQNYRLRPNTLTLWRFLAQHDLGSLLSARVTFHTGKLVNEQAAWMRHGEKYRVLPLELAVHFVDISCCVGGRVLNWDSVRVDSSPEGAGTTKIDARGEFEDGAWISLDLDATGVARRTNVVLEFERTALELVFFPEGFRVLPAVRNPLDDGAFASRQFVHALRQQIGRRMGGSSDRGLPHRAIYLEHARRVREQDDASPFSLSGVTAVTESLNALSEEVFKPV